MHKLIAALLIAVIVTPAVASECMRIVPRDPKRGPDMDGPGAFGPLQDTLTLGCLRFVDTINDKGKLTAVLVDEKGKQFRVTTGSSMGENSGRITEITEDRITLTQVVRGADGEYIEVLRYVFREKS